MKGRGGENSVVEKIREIGRRSEQKSTNSSHFLFMIIDYETKEKEAMKLKTMLRPIRSSISSVEVECKLKGHGCF